MSTRRYKNQINDLNKNIKELNEVIKRAHRAMKVWATQIGGVPFLDGKPADVEDPWETFRLLCLYVKDPSLETKAIDLDWKPPSSCEKSLI